MRKSAEMGGFDLEHLSLKVEAVLGSQPTDQLQYRKAVPPP